MSTDNSDLIACTVILKDGTKFRRFLVIDVLQLILVEPDSKRLGWGIAKNVGFLQDVEVVGDKDDSRCLHITVHRGGATTNRNPILSAKFVFDDHIRCMAAKQRLTKVCLFTLDLEQRPSLMSKFCCREEVKLVKRKCTK